MRIDLEELALRQGIAAKDVDDAMEGYANDLPSDAVYQSIGVNSVQNKTFTMG